MDPPNPPTIPKISPIRSFLRPRSLAIVSRFVTEHLGQRHTDMLWRIGTTGGDWVYILILLEFQSTVDRRMALSLMDYTATIWMRLGGVGGAQLYGHEFRMRDSFHGTTVATSHPEWAQVSRCRSRMPSQ